MLKMQDENHPANRWLTANGWVYEGVVTDGIPAVPKLHFVSPGAKAIFFPLENQADARPTTYEEDVIATTALVEHRMQLANNSIKRKQHLLQQGI